MCFGEDVAPTLASTWETMNRSLRTLTALDAEAVEACRQGAPSAFTPPGTPTGRDLRALGGDDLVLNDGRC